MEQERSVDKKKMEASEGVWIVLKYDGVYGAIGRVQGHRKLDDNSRNQILTTKGSLCLDIAFDYAEMFRPTPQIGEDGKPTGGMQMVREPLITNVGFISEEETLTYVRDWKRLTFFDDMKVGSKGRYIGFRDSAIKGSEDRRLADTGLINPNDPRLQRMPDENGRPHYKIDLRP